MFNNFDDTTTLQNPMFSMKPQQFGNPITEQEIQNHKNRLNRLITRLINTHNLDEETSINNEIRNETKFLSSLLNIKRNDLIQNNNMNNNNNFFNPMINQNNNNNNYGMLNNNIMQQQMLQQNMMQQQMMEPLDKKMQQKNFEDNSNFSCQWLTVIFRKSSESSDEPPVMVQCMPDETVSEIIEKYRNKSGDYDLSKKFIYNAKALHPSLNMAEAGLIEGANIFVVSPHGLRGG